MYRRSIPFWISAVIHFLVIGAASVLLIKPVEFAIDAGHASVEVNLVAAAPDSVTPPPPAPEPQELVSTQPPKLDDVIVPVAHPVPPVPTPAPEPVKVVTPPSSVVPPTKVHHVPTVAKGDGSAPKPGKDAITASADGGALVDAKPDYLSNPPPVYPESSRRDKQEGVVLLEVIVNAEGRPDSVSIQNSSGFTPLDQAAVDAVLKWRFRPASLGNIKVKSRVVIPVRFRLEG